MTNKLISFACVVLVLFTSGCKQRACICPGGLEPLKGGDVVATVGGEAITRKELWEEGTKGRRRMRLKNYWVEMRALERLVNRMVVAQVAKKAGMNVEDYEEKMVGDKVGEPSEDELKTTYRMRETTEPFLPPFDEARSELIEQFKQNKRAYMMKQHTSKLRAEADIKIFRAGPGIEVEVKGWPSVGPDDAPIILVEFFDYMNPISMMMRKPIDELLEKYKGKVKHVYRDLPTLSYASFLWPHLAAHCAGDQGKYFPYSKKVVEQRSRMEVDDFKRLAKELGLDMKTFNQCLTEKKHLDLIKRSVAEAREIDIISAPAFFINGRFLAGPLPPYAFREIIEGELEKQRNP